MPFPIRVVGTTGQTYRATLTRESDGFVWSVAASEWQAAPTYANSKITLTEGSSQYACRYSGSVAGVLLGDAGWVNICIHDEGQSNKTVSNDAAYVQNGSEVTAALQPTTAFRTLDVSIGGEAGVDWANVGTPSSTVNLSATTVGVVASLTALSSAALASIWDRLTSALTTAGSIGKYILDKLALLGAGQVTVTAPVASDDTVTIIRGDDYDNDESRALSWTSSSWSISGATISFRVYKPNSNTSELTVAGTAASATLVRVELTAAQTAALTSNTYRYEVIATLSARVQTLVRGTLKVKGE